MAENTKDNFVLHESVQKPLKELEDLNAQIKKKKQEVKKAMFFAKHPGLRVAKEELDTKMAEDTTAKFNESLLEEPKRPVKDPVRDEVKVPVRKLKSTVKEPEIEPEIEPVKIAEPIKPAIPIPAAPKAFVLAPGGVFW